jgi:hypothetical protein
VFSTTFSNISATSWRSVLEVEEAEVPENHLLLKVAIKDQKLNQINEFEISWLSNLLIVTSLVNIIPEPRCVH